jgi:hypothetical protein
MSRKKPYKTGKNNPPLANQFKKGQSGNPAGRPKGAKNLKTDLKEIMLEGITLNEGGKTVTISKQRALLKRLVVSGLQGNAAATATILSLVLKLLDDEEPQVDNSPLSPNEQAILDRLTRQISDESSEPNPSKRK